MALEFAKNLSKDNQLEGETMVKYLKSLTREMMIDNVEAIRLQAIEDAKNLKDFETNKPICE